MAWRGSFSRSFFSTAFRSSPSLSAARRVRQPSLAAPRFKSRRLSFSNPRTLGELGCTQSLMPLHNVLAGARLTSHLTVSARACCELYNGTFCRSCQDR